MAKKKNAMQNLPVNKTTLAVLIVVAIILGLLVALAFSPVGAAVIEKIGASTSDENASTTTAPPQSANVVRLGGTITANEAVVLENVVFKAHFVDVGQGDAIILEFKDGLTIMVDGGSSPSGLTATRAELLSYMAMLSLDDIDYLIVTHPDTDHYNMLTAVMDAYEVKNVIYNNCTKNATYTSLIKRINEEVSGEHNLAIDADGCDYTITGEYCTVNVYAPGYDRFENGDGEYDASESNGMSPIITVESAGRKLLLTGDAVGSTTETWFIEKLGGTAYDVDFLKVGHHGSDTSSSEAFLDYVTAEYAIIMCDDGSAYKHPIATVMNKLFDRSIITYRTNRHGNIVLYIDDDGDFAFGVENEVPVENNKNLNNDHMLITK